MPTDAASIDRYVQHLGAIAHCLANDCGAPELWEKLCGTPDDNPLLQWDQWYGMLPQRMERLEYESLISEAQAFIDNTNTLQGTAARQHEALLYGRLGDLLFHSGQVSAAIDPLQSALDLCREIHDVEGQFTYLSNLLEVYRYLGSKPDIILTAEQLLDLSEKYGVNSDNLKKRIERLRFGEPLCRIVCVRDDGELELDGITEFLDGRYDFEYRRNRLSLQKATVLVRQGNTLASSGQLADALEKYQEAMDVDPHDPDPVYQSGICLLELGAYGQARAAFEQVERLAPGWFRCRNDQWLAQSLETGNVIDEEFRVLRVLDDGGLEASQAFEVARQAIERFPDFAPLHLIMGDLQRDRGESEEAIASYRIGLELVEEPDLESRLLCHLAGTLPQESAERMELVERAVNLEGSLVAQAMAKLIRLQ